VVLLPREGRKATHHGKAAAAKSRRQKRNALPALEMPENSKTSELYFNHFPSFMSEGFNDRTHSSLVEIFNSDLNIGMYVTLKYSTTDVLVFPTRGCVVVCARTVILASFSARWREFFGRARRARPFMKERF